MVYIMSTNILFSFSKTLSRTLISNVHLKLILLNAFNVSVFSTKPEHLQSLFYSIELRGDFRSTLSTLH